MKCRLLSLMIIVALTGAFFFFSCRKDKMQDSYSIVKKNGRWLLLRNNDPYYIKGAAAGRFYDKVKAHGGNSVRFFDNFQHNLDSARKYNLTALFNLPFRGEREGMDFKDRARVEDEKKRITDTVRKYMHHPALMLWSVGNELDYVPGGDHNMKLWTAVNELAGKIHEIDPAHPVMTVVGSGGLKENTRKLQEISRLCPNLDLLGINSYGDLPEYSQLVHEYWKKPYLVTEFGPVGDWQAERTKWKAPLEQTSTQKAMSFRNSYRIISDDSLDCLGSYVFSWLQYLLRTPTWYGMIDKNGLESQAVEVMQNLWTGTDTQNHAPRIDSIFIEGMKTKDSVCLKKGSVHEAFVISHDPDNDSLEYIWELYPEVIHFPSGYTRETPTEAIPELILTPNSDQIKFRTPEKPGAYRLFLNMLDNRGHFAGGNIPFYVPD